MISEEMKTALMAVGLSKQQATSTTAEAVINFMMNGDEKIILQEARNQVAEMQKILDDLRMDYSQLKLRIESISGVLIDIAKAQEEHGGFSDERARNAVALYGAIVNMNERAGARGEASVDNAGYVTYAYLGGQARREISYDASNDDNKKRF